MKLPNIEHLRKIRDKFNAIKSSVEEDMRSGNKSKYAGELSEQYSLVEQICREIEEADETKLNKKDEKNKLSKLLEATEEVILSKKEYGKRKRADGSIVDHSSDKKKKDGFDDALVGLVNSLNNSDATGQEAVVERKLMDWLTSNGKTSEDLLKEANVMEGSDAHDISLALLNELGIDTLINIYCAKGNSFEPKEFKSSLRDLGFPPLVYHKIYKVISQWMEMVTSSKETPSSGNDDFRIRATLTESSSSGDNFEITDEGETDRLVY